ncbi:MAG TPA: hypothetical protein VHQ47_20280 [Phycisphaerae bacterium]|jgi:hypothetical protein|nr:hypothetical protein [Phycisphaerae bacterium]
MMVKRTGRGVRRPAVLAALETERVRRALVEGRMMYAVMDVVELAADGAAEDAWRTLTRRDPGITDLCLRVPLSGGEADEAENVVLAADMEGVLRILQGLEGPRAASVRQWLSACGAIRIEEADNPELAVVRARREYERRGYPRQWVDQRMRSISARAEVVGEWYKRGAQDSEDFRRLTNALMQESFGMDVEGYRQHKGLFGRENLRDHMSDMELALVSLGETVGATLHRSHGSKSVEELEADMIAAGHIVAETRGRIEKESGRSVIEGERKAWSERRNPTEEPGGREVIYRAGSGSERLASDA